MSSSSSSSMRNSGISGAFSSNSQISSSKLKRKVWQMRSQASLREKKEVKVTSPLMVVKEMLLSINIAFIFFSTFLMSSLGKWMKVPPKNKLDELKPEWKQMRSFVMQMRPCSTIFSTSAHEQDFISFSFSLKLTFSSRNSRFFSSFSSVNIVSLGFVFLGGAPVDSSLLMRTAEPRVSLFTSEVSLIFSSFLSSLEISDCCLKGFFIFLKSSTLENSPSKQILRVSFLRPLRGISLKQAWSFSSTLSMSCWYFSKFCWNSSTPKYSSWYSRQNEKYSFRVEQTSETISSQDFFSFYEFLAIFSWNPLMRCLMNSAFCATSLRYSRTFTPFSSSVNSFSFSFFSSFFPMNFSMLFFSSSPNNLRSLFSSLVQVWADCSLVTVFFISFSLMPADNSKKEFTDLRKLTRRLPKDSPSFLFIFSKNSRISLTPTRQFFSMSLRCWEYRAQSFLVMFLRFSICSSTSLRQLRSQALQFSRNSSLIREWYSRKRGMQRAGCRSAWLKHSRLEESLMVSNKVPIFSFSKANFSSAMLVIIMRQLLQKYPTKFLVSPMILEPITLVTLMNSSGSWLQKWMISPFLRVRASVRWLMKSYSSSIPLQAFSQAQQRLVFSSMLQMSVTSEKELLQASMLRSIFLWERKYFLESSLRICSYSWYLRMEVWKLMMILEKSRKMVLQRAVSSLKEPFELLAKFAVSLLTFLIRKYDSWQKEVPESLDSSSATFLAMLAEQASKNLEMSWKKSMQSWVALRWSSAFLKMGWNASSVMSCLGMSPLKPCIFIQYYQHDQDQLTNHPIVSSVSVQMLRLCSHRFCTQLKRIRTRNTILQIRNSETLQLTMDLFTDTGAMTSESLRLPRAGTLQDLSAQLHQKLHLTNIKFLCNDKILLHDGTPLDILINRYFYIYSDETHLIEVEGQLFSGGKAPEVIEGIATLELPAVTKNEVERYFKRVNMWTKFKTGREVVDDNLKLSSANAAEVFVEAVIDPLPQERLILQEQRRWEALYWKVEELKQKKKEADELCLSRVKRQMMWGLAILGANIGIIWSGTYIFYSWDIIEPIAYFLSSLGAIVLASQFFRIGRPYSNHAYQQYLMRRMKEKVYKELGFDLLELKTAQYELMESEAVLKDHFLKRM